MKRLSEYIHFVHSHRKAEDKCIFYCDKTVTPLDPLKYPTGGGKARKKGKEKSIKSKEREKETKSYDFGRIRDLTTGSRSTFEFPSRVNLSTFTQRCM